MRRWSSLVGAGTVVLAASVAALDLARPGFYAAHDNLLNVQRLYELERCLADGEWLCVWAPDLGAGMGVPLFQYYAPLPTWIAALLHATGLSLTSAVQASAGLALFVLALGAFVLGRSLWGARGGAIAGTLAVTAPYLAVDVYVRGALNETWGLALLPWLLHATRSLARRAGAGASVGTALAGAALVLAHPLVCIAALPLGAAWLGMQLQQSRTARTALARLAAAGGSGALLCAFYWLPLLLERDAIHREQLIGRYDWSRWSGNFLSPLELLTGTGPWGYGPFRSEGGMSIFVGALLLAGAAAGIALARSRLGRVETEARGTVAWLGAATAGTLLLATPLSRALWSLLPPLAYLQFPWRFLGPANLGLALLAGACGPALRRHGSRAGALLATLVLCGAATAWNARYFRAEAQAPVADALLANRDQLARTRHGLFDYLPIAVDPDALPRPPPVVAPRAAVALPPGSAAIELLHDGPHELRLRVRSESGTLLRVQRHDFPHWRARLDGQPIAFEERDDPRGRLHLRLPAGVHTVTVTLEASAPRRAGRALSLLGLPALALLAWRSRVPASGGKQ